MNHVDSNRINNFIYRYCIKDTAENFNKLGVVIKQRKFYIYHTILYIIDNWRIVKEDSTGITVEICLDEQRNLLEDLMNNFFTKKFRTRKVETKVGHGYTTGKLKHLALPSVYYRLLSTSYIFTYNSYLYCGCYQFPGCRTKPINGMIADRNYCYVCHVKVTYNEEKIKS